MFESPHHQAEEQWMRDNQELIDWALRPFFDQLVLPLNPLADPYWLVGLLQTARQNRERSLASLSALEFDRGHEMVLAAAVRGIDQLTARPPDRKRSDRGWVPGKIAVCSR
jgi:hypothetical protein